MAEDSIQAVDNDPRIADAIQFLQFANEADQMNRSEALEDLKFAAGDQWPVEIQNSRVLEARPCLTVNKVDAYCRQLTNQMRQQRPRMKAHGMNNESDARMAEIISGIFRHIETQSDADQAYDKAGDFAVRMGWGYWRVTTDYVRDDSFDQEIYIKAIDNPFTVYFDPNSTAPDGSDAEKVLITTVISKDNFKKMYPNAETEQGFTMRGTGDTNPEWVMKEDIRLAEYFYTERKSITLYQLSDGTTVKSDELPSAEELEAMGLSVVDKRNSYEKKIRWCKLTSMEVLEEGEWAGKYIPIIPVYGQETVVENKKKKFGIVRMAKDPQRMYNFWQTSLTESVALAPKAKWLLAEGQDEGHENEWAQANIKSMPVLRYKQKDIDGQPAPPPQRLQPEPPPTGVMAAAQAMTTDLMQVVGIFDPAQLPTGNISGKALQGQQQQVDMTNFHYYDNLTRSIRQTGKVILDLIPKIYDKERVMRIIGDDGKPEILSINQYGQDEEGIYKILNDVTVGEYDVVMDTGPGYNSKRQEAVDSMMAILSADPTLMQQAGDLIFRNMDFPGAETIADRLAVNNPLAQIDDKSKVPPQVQMQLKQQEAQLQQAQQVIQKLQQVIQDRTDTEQVKQDAETKRELMRQTAKAHDIELRNQERLHATDIRAETQEKDTKLKTDVQLEIEQMKGQFAILLAHIDAAARRGAASETEERAI
ncbi:Phage P22-like portal protein [uncultured Caudovirales phage]|uniref:Phage P22-like portal protein n=1 Tax=uncultured Caudovirales phage TaxID=2100421 RepID=A0A6J5L3R2_9CAUD|nr:Phage P22-like portal protein [uncultured Caudovirales phage]